MSALGTLDFGAKRTCCLFQDHPSGTHLGRAKGSVLNWIWPWRTDGGETAVSFLAAHLSMGQLSEWCGIIVCGGAQVEGGRRRAGIWELPGHSQEAADSSSKVGQITSSDERPGWLASQPSPTFPQGDDGFGLQLTGKAGSLHIAHGPAEAGKHVSFFTEHLTVPRRCLVW